MAPKIYRSDGSLLVRNADGATLELSNDDAITLAREIIGMLAPTEIAKRRARWTAEMRETLRRMYVDEGVGDSQIARTMGLRPSQVSTQRQNLGISGRNQKVAKRARAMMIARHRQAAE